MDKKQHIILEQWPHPTDPARVQYIVTEMRNTQRFGIGAVVSEREVAELHSTRCHYTIKARKGDVLRARLEVQEEEG